MRGCTHVHEDVACCTCRASRLTTRQRDPQTTEAIQCTSHYNKLTQYSLIKVLFRPMPSWPEQHMVSINSLIGHVRDQFKRRCWSASRHLQPTPRTLDHLYGSFGRSERAHMQPATASAGPKGYLCRHARKGPPKSYKPIETFNPLDLVSCASSVLRYPRWHSPPGPGATRPVLPCMHETASPLRSASTFGTKSGMESVTSMNHSRLLSPGWTPRMASKTVSLVHVTRSDPNSR